METLLYVGTVTVAVVLIVRGEVSVRRADRRYAQEFPLKIDSARTELKVRRQATALHKHLTEEDLIFLGDNDWPPAAEELHRKRLTAAPQPEPLSGEVTLSMTPSYYANAFYTRYGRFPWEQVNDRKTRRSPYLRP